MGPNQFIEWIDQQITFWNKASSQVADDMEKSYINGRLSTFYDMKSQFVYLMATYFKVSQLLENQTIDFTSQTTEVENKFTDGLADS